MYRFTAVSHVLYRSTVNNVLSTGVGRQMSGFEPSLLCFLCFFFALVSVIFWGVGEGG